jgi:hypothetical protein
VLVGLLLVPAYSLLTASRFSTRIIAKKGVFF